MGTIFKRIRSRNYSRVYIAYSYFFKKIENIVNYYIFPFNTSDLVTYSFIKHLKTNDFKKNNYQITKTTVEYKKHKSKKIEEKLKVIFKYQKVFFFKKFYYFYFNKKI